MNGRLIWEARRLGHALGWPGVAGVLLFAVAAVLQFKAVDPLQAEVTNIQTDAEGLRAKVATRKAVSRAATPVSKLAQFYDFFPDGDAMAETLDRLRIAAAAENLMLDQGEYRLAPESVGKLARYDIVLPVKGSYPKVRRFIARALRENASLALEGVSFSRASALSIGVDAQVRLTLFLQEAL